MWSLFFGCLLVAYGPACAFLCGAVLGRSHLTLLAVTAAFFELVGFLAASLVWFAFPPGAREARAGVATALGVLLQEAARAAFVWGYGRGELGLASASASTSLPFGDFASAVASGFGFALMYALLVYGSVLGLALDEADYFAPFCPGTSIFLVSALCSLAFQVLHVFLMVIAFDAARGSRPWAVLRYGVVVAFHMTASLVTLFNADASLGGCRLGMPLLFMVVALCVVYALLQTQHPLYHVKSTFQRVQHAAPEARLHQR